MGLLTRLLSLAHIYSIFCLAGLKAHVASCRLVAFNRHIFISIKNDYLFLDSIHQLSTRSGLHMESRLFILWKVLKWFTTGLPLLKDFLQKALFWRKFNNSSILYGILKGNHEWIRFNLHTILLTKIQYACQDS